MAAPSPVTSDKSDAHRGAGMQRARDRDGGWNAQLSARHVVKTTESTSMRYSAIWRLLKWTLCWTVGNPCWHVYSISDSGRRHPRIKKYQPIQRPWSMPTCLSHRTKNFWTNRPLSRKCHCNPERSCMATLTVVMFNTSQCKLSYNIPEFTRNECSLHCDVLHITTVRVARLVLDDPIAAIQTSR